MKAFDPSISLIVGKYYNVPCAALQYYDGLKLLPIIGIEHADPQFDFKEKHYHYDGRFSNYGIDGRANEVIETSGRRTEYKFLGIVVRRRKCMRLNTGLIVPDTTWEMNNHWFVLWYKSMLGKSCAGRKCPHLGTIMESKNGVLVCPLHNLHGSLKKEFITPVCNNINWDDRGFESFMNQ